MNRIRLTITLQDGTVHEDIAINNHAMVAYDFAANRNRWPAGTDAPFLWLTFLAWQQLVDLGLYEAKDDKGHGTFTHFQQVDCVDVDRVDTSDPVDPTQAGSEPASPSQPQPESAPTGFTDATTVS